MIVKAKSTSSDEFLQRIGVQPSGNIWSALIVERSDLEEIVEDLQETIEIFAECEVAVISCDRGTLDTLQQIRNVSASYFLLYDFEDWKDESKPKKTRLNFYDSI